MMALSIMPTEAIYEASYKHQYEALRPNLVAV